MNSRYPRRPGHSFAPLIDGVPFYTHLARAIDRAAERAWCIVSFIQPDFLFPDGRSLHAILELAARRGVDARVLFWRNPHFVLSTTHVNQGSPDDLARFSSDAPGVLARWEDSPHASHCHHQKAWVVDDEAMVGGMVLSTSTLATPSHHKGRKHDVMVSLRGPAVSDVMHTFAQRWNHAHLGFPSLEASHDLDLGALPELGEAGEADAHIARTVAPGLYGGDGEADILAAYLDLIEGAQRTVYIENQHPGDARVLRALRAALERGVEVVYIVPGEPMDAIRRAREAMPERYAETFDLLDALGDHDDFTLCALRAEGREIYVHAKLCIVDGARMTVGSANLVDLSMDPDHSELNVSTDHAPTSLDMLRRLVGEHTLLDVGEHSDQDLVTAIARCARTGAGHLYAIEPTGYAR